MLPDVDRKCAAISEEPHLALFAKRAGRARSFIDIVVIFLRVNAVNTNDTSL
jgi:hypothetical protein